jgi:hypothetical protein
MPPQQLHGLLDFLDQILGFRAHIKFQCRPSGPLSRVLGI